MKHTSDRSVWKYPFKAYLEAEYTDWPGEGVFPAALPICKKMQEKKKLKMVILDNSHNTVYFSVKNKLIHNYKLPQ